MPNRMAVASESSAVNPPTRRLGAVERARDSCSARHHSDQQLAQPDRQHQARAATHERHYQALGQQLAHQPSTSRAKRQSNRHLLLPAHRARQQQVGNVCARDEEHQAHHHHQHVERRRHQPAHIGQSTTGGVQIELLRPNRSLNSCDAARNPVSSSRSVDLSVYDVELCLCGFGGEGRLQATDDRQATALAMSRPLHVGWISAFIMIGTKTSGAAALTMPATSLGARCRRPSSACC